MRSRTEAGLPGRCVRCYLKVHLCLCGELPCVVTKAQFVVIRHPQEKEKSTGTARYAQLAMSRCLVWDGDSSTPALDAFLGSLEEACLLFPGIATDQAQDVAPKNVVVLDGTWRQVRRMLRRIPALWKMPRLSLPAAWLTTERLRQGPTKECLSTLEAIAGAVMRLDGEATGARLVEFNAMVVERVLLGRGLNDRARAMREKGTGYFSPLGGARNVSVQGEK